MAGPHDGHRRNCRVPGLEARAVEVQVQLSAGLPRFTIVGLPDKAVAESRERVHAALASIGLALPPKSGRELVVPCLMLLLLPLAFAFQGILPQIVALGFLGLTLLAFAHLLTLFMKKGTTVPNRYGAAPTAFSFAG